ncbi:MAG: glycerate kinase [Anaerolineales bacterium]|nr:glycerate kinase [Anaerolineales bacterium]
MGAHDRGLQAAAQSLMKAALAAVDPAAAVRRAVRRAGDVLAVGGRRYNLADYERVRLVAGGKAAVAMAGAAVDILAERLSSGVVVTKYGHGGGPTTGAPLQMIEAGHPVPDENSLRGAQAIADVVSGATERDLLICLISGGGSALLTLPVEGLSLSDVQSLTNALLRSGATIHEMNTVRKHWSRIKGGQLARLAAPATVITLILSDVVGDSLETIASGPTVPDPTTTSDAQAVLEHYAIPAAGRIPLQETPKAGDPAFQRVQNLIVASNRLAATAAVARARDLGFNTLLMGTFLEGEAREVGIVAAGLAKAIVTHSDPAPAPACLVWGGETTVTVRGAGKGGRNQELALAAALALDGWPDVLVVALATDGTDGPTDAAGAVVTGETAQRARKLGLVPLEALQANDSYPLLDATGSLLKTGPTGTNVNDLLFILAGHLP